MTENDIIKFQISRNVKNLGKSALILLESAQNHIKTLESLLLQMGITKYENSNFNYLKDRKVILDKVGDAERDLIALVNSFEIHLKKE